MTNQSPCNPSRPLLTYFGGKWAIAPWIIEHLPPHKIYVEPFGGAASVMLRKPRSKVEVYNDLDDEIVNIFRVLQDPASTRELFRRLARTPYARAEYDLACAERVVDPVVRAQRAIIRANMAFSICATRRSPMPNIAAAVPIWHAHGARERARSLRLPRGCEASSSTTAPRGM